MEQLDLLWSLENHHKSLKNKKKQLAILEDEIKNQDEENKLLRLKSELDKNKDLYEGLKRSLKKSEQGLKDHNYKISEIEENLYEGKIKDIKQLSLLEREKDKIKDMTNSLEIDILEMIEKVEYTKESLEILEKKYLKLRKDYSIRENEYLEKKADLERDIGFDEETISSVEESISSDLLKKYYSIKNSKGSGIARVDATICRGCNMHISMVIMDKLNLDRDLVCCENCGRILYK